MKKFLSIIMILCMVLGTGAFAYADVTPDYTGIDETENLIGEEETLEQGGSLSEEAKQADTEDTRPYIYVGLHGDDEGGDGTSSKPFATFERALNAAKILSESTTADGIVICVIEDNNGSELHNNGVDLLMPKQFELTNAINKPITLTTAPGATEPALVRRDSYQNGVLFYIGAGAELILENISICGWNGQPRTDSLFQVKGTLTMKEGTTLWRNSASHNGGGVNLNEGGTFNMSGGEIKGNISDNKGGGVFVDQNSTFNMSGGIIGGAAMAADGITDGNTSSRIGGGVCIARGGTFNMSGGTIGGSNFSYKGGGGVYMEEDSKFNMTAGTIKDNKVINNGGSGVFISAGSTFTMSGGTITGNYDETSHNSRPVASGAVMKEGRLNLSGTPNITGNKA